MTTTMTRQKYFLNFSFVEKVLIFSLNAYFFGIISSKWQEIKVSQFTLERFPNILKKNVVKKMTEDDLLLMGLIKTDLALI